MTFAAQSYSAGEADAPALVLSEPLSLWGGIDVQTGRVIDRSHPDLGRCVSGHVLVMPGGRGSSSSASVLAEAMRCGTAPAGIVLTIPDPILTVGALIAGFLYERRCPIVVCASLDVATGDRVRIRAGESGPAELDVEPLPLLIEFTGGTSLFRERDRPSQFPIVGNGPPGTFVVFPDGLRVSLPTDQVVYASDDGGCARVGFGGMAFAGTDDGRLVFHRVRELHAEERLSPERSHTMRLEPRLVAAVRMNGRLRWPAAEQDCAEDR
jgi:predicted aconitase with swiveling domain